MSRRILICPKHNLPRMTSYGRLRCVECKREADARHRQSVKEKRLAGMARARQKREDEALDVRVERIWRERYSAEEAAYYREIRVVGARTVWA